MKYIFLLMIPFLLKANELAVPYFKQEQEYTCELASLRMVLAYYKINVSEKELIDLVPKDSTPKKGNIWGDPDLGFVGDLYGRTAEVSYGIHWKPMSTFANRWRRTKIITNADPAMIQKFLKNKNPILAWIAPVDAPELNWKTPKGKMIKSYLGEHVVVITELKNNVIKFNDPMNGIKVENLNDFLLRWKKFNYSGLVIY